MKWVSLGMYYCVMKEVEPLDMADGLDVAKKVAKEYEDQSEDVIVVSKGMFEIYDVNDLVALGTFKAMKEVVTSEGREVNEIRKCVGFWNPTFAKRRVMIKLSPEAQRWMGRRFIWGKKRVKVV